jgi:hypothetical protein
MNNFELDYENDERRIEFMTRAPWLKNKITGQIVYSSDGYPIGDNARDPRWKGYPMSLHFNNGVMNSLPLLTGPTEFYMSDGHYAMYVPKPTDYDPNVFTYARLLRERYKDYLEEVRRADRAALTTALKELLSTKRAMKRELEKEYAKLKQLEIRAGREDAAKRRKSRAAARGVEVAPDDGSVKETYDSKLAEINNIEQNLRNIETLIKQLRININSV